MCSLPNEKTPHSKQENVFHSRIALVWFTGAQSQASYFYATKLIHRNATPYCVYSWEPAFDQSEAYEVDSSIFLVSFTIILFILLTSLYSAVIVSLQRQKARLHLASDLSCDLGACKRLWFSQFICMDIPPTL